MPKPNYHQLPVSTGVVTHVAPETVMGQPRSAINMDGFDEFRAIGKTPGCSRLNATSTDAIRSIHSWTHIDYDRKFKRSLLVATDDEQSPPVYHLRKIDLGTGAVSEIGTGGVNFVIDLAEPMAQAVMNNRIHLTSPGQKGDKAITGGFKYDGTRATNWGVLAPGSTPTVPTPTDSPAVFHFDDASLWVAGVGNAADTDNFIHRLSTTTGVKGGVQLNKTGTGFSKATLAYTDAVPFSMDPGGSQTLKYWVFLPSGAFQILSTNSTPTLDGGAVWVRLYDDDGATDGAHFAVNIGELVLGWNEVTIDTTAGVPISGGLASIASVGAVTFGFYTNNIGDLIDGITFDYLRNVDDVAATATPTAPADSTSTIRAGLYRYRTTYLTETGLESNAGIASAGATITEVSASGTLTISGVTIADEEVIIGSQTYTFVADPTEPFDLLLGTAAASGIALRKIINDGNDRSAGANLDVTATDNGSGTVSVTAIISGNSENSIATTETGANMAWASGTLTGGTDGQDIDLTTIPVSPDEQVIARRIYRDQDGDAVFRFVTQIDDNITLIYTDVFSQDSLAIVVPPTAAGFIDSSPPEAMFDCITYQGRVFGIRGTNRVDLLISEINQAEAFPVNNTITIDEPMTALKEHDEGLLIYTTDLVFLLSGQGTPANPFILTLRNNQLGANNPRSVLKVKGFNIVVRELQAFLVEDVANEWYLNGGIQDQWDADFDTSKISDFFIVHDRLRFRVLFFGKDSSSDYKIWSYQYATQGISEVSSFGRGINPMDVRNGIWQEVGIPATELTPTCAIDGERDTETPEVWVGTSEGYVLFFGDPATTNWETDSNFAVSAELEFGSVPLGLNPGERGEPRYLEFDVTSTGTSVWVVTVEILSGSDGTSIATSSSFNLTLGAGNSSPSLSIPAINVRGAWARVKLTNAVSGENARFRSIRLYYIPRRGGSHGGPRTS